MKNFISPAKLVASLLVCMTALLASKQAPAWQSVENPLMTEWGEKLDPAQGVWTEYPRPTMQRSAWENLNGLWQYAVTPKDAPKPETWDGEILVPFCVQSALSGVKKEVSTDQALWYRRTVDVPAGWHAGKILLHFDAVDWEATVWLNGHELGIHRGGYDRFSFDLTPHLAEGNAQELVVRVWDPTDEGTQPRGKQVLKPNGIWYTAVTGIWQTVWMEPVPEAHINAVRITPNLSDGSVAVQVIVGAGRMEFKAEALKGSDAVGTAQAGTNETATIKLGNVQPWTPDNPHLYALKVTLLDRGQAVDSVESYFGMRGIKIARDANGVNRIMLNGQPLFQYGPLDQGWWPDGLYTAPSDDALKFDIVTTKNLRFNMIRKHVKVEPERWYYHCDRLGMLVWQDLPNGDQHIGPEAPDIERSLESETQYFVEYQEMIEQHWNHPSIIMWVPFNEGWGQFASEKVTEFTRRLDPTRLVNTASGWAERGIGDVHDIHRYPGPAMPPLEEKRAAVLGEFGGLGLPLEGHLWVDERNWGYRTYKTREELQDNYDRLLISLHHLIGSGLAAAVYTQTTDVETEVNGLMTYDRKVIKFGEDWLARRNEVLYGPPPTLSVLLPTGESDPQPWRHTLDRPKKDWPQPAYNDSTWQDAPAPFGTQGTPGINVRTTWDTRDIYLRRNFNLDTVPGGRVLVRIYHDEDAEVFINGVQAALDKGHTTDYTLIPISQEAHATLKPGENHIAVHCRQTDGGQGVDVGLMVQSQPAD